MKKISFLIILGILFVTASGLTEETKQPEVSSAVFSSLVVDSTGKVNHLKFIIQGRKPGNFEPILDTRKAVQRNLDYFFVSLNLPREAFWVNLNPDEPKRIVDSSLGETDFGRIMLQADLRLKEDAASLTNPQNSKIGREFWQRVYKKAQELGVMDKISVSTRLWIVPDEAAVYEERNKFSIIKSRLKVCLEPAYLSKQSRHKYKEEYELDNFTSKLMQEMILPELNRKVNEAYDYADLREAYNTLILAAWYKEKFSPSTEPLLRQASYNITEGIEINDSYTPKQIYQDYLKSLKEGEYSFIESDYLAGPFYAATKHYFSGGVDFRNVRVSRIYTEPQAQDASGIVFACDLFIPQDERQPLMYAKNQLQISTDSSLEEGSIMLAKDLPAIKPVRETRVSMQSLNSIDRTERMLLSKL